MEWRIGCSGYHYPEWKGVFYPEEISQRKWFEYYCTHFNTLELNNTFYRFPRLDFLKSWYDRSPGNFIFALKAPRHITHFKKSKETRRMLADFNKTALEGLREKLGCVLFQFPANYAFDRDRLNRIAELADPSVKNIVEFRNASWWSEEVFDRLKSHQISFCGMSHPSLPETPVSTTDTLYYRFHGVPHLYSSQYNVQKLDQLVHALAGTNSEEKKAYVYFNNTADGHAVTNAKQLQEICELVH